MWMVLCTVGYHPALFIVQGHNATHARKRLLASWRQNKMLDATFPNATTVDDMKNAEQQNVPIIKVQVRGEDGTLKMVDFLRVEDALTQVWLKRVDHSAVWVCALDG
jgi:hypothetical protein